MPKRVNFIFDWRHKRRLANGCIVTALALSLVACSKGPSQSQDQTNPGSGNPPLSGAERQRRSETPVAPKMPPSRKRRKAQPFENYGERGRIRTCDPCLLSPFRGNQSVCFQ